MLTLILRMRIGEKIKDYSIPGPTFVASGILFREQVLVPFFFSFSVHLECFRIFNTQSVYKFTPELLRYCQFQKYFKNFCFHRNKYKRQIKYRAEPLFFKIDFKNSSVMRLLSFSVVYGCQYCILCYICRIPRANLYLGKLKICSYDILFLLRLEG